MVGWLGKVRGQGSKGDIFIVPSLFGAKFLLPYGYVIFINTCKKVQLNVGNNLLVGKTLHKWNVLPQEVACFSEVPKNRMDSHLIGSNCWTGKWTG